MSEHLHDAGFPAQAQHGESSQRQHLAGIVGQLLPEAGKQHRKDFQNP